MTARVRVVQPNSALVCLYEVVSSRQANEQAALDYCRRRLRSYLQEQWTQSKLRRLVQRLRRESRVQAAADGQRDPLRAPQPDEADEPEEAAQQRLHQHLLGRLEERPPVNSPVRLLQQWMQLDGLQQGRLRSRLRPNVAQTLHGWRMELFVKLFSLADADQKQQKLHLRCSDQGDVSGYFNNCIQCSADARRDPAFYRSVASLLRDQPANVLFVTSLADEARAAHAAGMPCLLVRPPAAATGDSTDPSAAAGPAEQAGCEFPVVEAIEQVDFYVDPTRALQCC